MRKLIPLLFAIMASATAAQAYEVTSCRTEASLAADEWVKGNLIDGAEASQMEPAPLIIIAAGRKYGVARNAVDQETLRPLELGNLARQRHLVYQEELNRCLGHFTVEIVDGGDYIYEYETLRHPGHR